MEPATKDRKSAQDEEIRDEIFLKKLCDNDKKLLNLIAEIIVNIILQEEL